MPYKDQQRRNQRARERWAERRAAYFTGRTCVDCGTGDDLELDHVDATVKVDHRIWAWGEERRAVELQKCVARCATCHTNKTVAFAENARGVRIGASKFTDDNVRDIRTAFVDGQTKRGLARAYGVSDKTIRLILSGETWRHVA